MDKNQASLQALADILERIRSLAVQAASDFSTQPDKNTLQAEISQLLLEIDSIGGSQLGSNPYVNASYSIVSNAVLASDVGSGTGKLVAGVTKTNVFDTFGPDAAVDGTIELQVVNAGSSSVAVQVTFLTSASNAVCAVKGKYICGQSVTVDGLSIIVGNATVADIGMTAYIKISQAVAATASYPLDAQSLRVANINVAVTSPGNGAIGAEDAIGQIDAALTMLVRQRAIA